MLWVGSMSEPRKVHCYASVDQPYAVVRAALHRSPVSGVTGGPAHVCIVSDQESSAGLPSLTRVTLDWEHAGASAAPPVTSAEIYASATSESKTALEVEGHWYATPGDTSEADRAQAESCVQALLAGFLDRLRQEAQALERNESSIETGPSSVGSPSGPGSLPSLPRAGY
jgi:hypothetical protein